jgi:hypothetical protein
LLFDFVAISPQFGCYFAHIPPQLAAMRRNAPQFAAIRVNSPQFAKSRRKSPQFATLRRTSPQFRHNFAAISP